MMLKGLFSKSGGLKIRIMGSTHDFPDMDAFEHFIAGKTDVPGDKITGLLSLSDDDLESEIKQIGFVENKINSKLADSINNPGMIDQYLGEATLTRFTQDHDWRSIIFELSGKDTEFTDYKTAAITYYLKYLRARRIVMENILQNRGDKSGLSSTQVFDLQEEDVDSSKTVFARTAVIDLTETEDTPAIEKLTRLKKGVGKDIDAGDLPEIPIRMASRRFTLRFGEPLVLVDDQQREYSLGPGENMVGRDLNCHVRLDNSFPDMSRRHVIINALGGSKLKITDLSSQGTYIPATLA